MMIKNYFAIFTLFVNVMPLTSFAWNAQGHKLVAQIAYQHLDQDAQAQVDLLLNKQFIQASTWADQVRARGDDSMNTWHYINLPNPGPKKNVVDAISDSQKILNNPKALPADKIRALKGLIHWVGDIHQPLHTIDRDRGGTAFILAGNPLGKNLHQLWDNGAGSFKNMPSFTQAASSWAQAYPPSAEQMAVIDPIVWAQEGYLLATTKAYVGITPRSLPSEAYLENAEMIVHQQIVLAGMRLAKVINTIEGNIK